MFISAKSADLRMEKFGKILYEMERTYSKIMSDLHNKIDSKFEAFEKRIEETIPPCEAMPVDTGRVDIQGKQQKLRQGVLNLKDKFEIYVNLMQTRMEQLKVEHGKISEEIKTVQQVGIVSGLEELSGLERSKKAVVELHRKAICHMQGEFDRLERELKILKNELEHLASLSAARKSAFSDNLKRFEEVMIRLNNKKCILKERISEIEERRATVVDNAQRKVTEMEMEMKAMTEESETIKNELEGELKALDICEQESENLSRRRISPSPCQQDM